MIRLLACKLTLRCPFFLLLMLFCFNREVLSQTDPLLSWNEGASKQAILDFVTIATDATHPDYVPLEDRVATFDQDGTLWIEKPNYTQFYYTIDRLQEILIDKPTFLLMDAFKTIRQKIEGGGLSSLSLEDAAALFGRLHVGVTVDEFNLCVQNWLLKARDSRFKRPYSELVYQPMLELLQFLKNNGFKTYIVSGSGQDFSRAFSEYVYGIPRERVIGTACRVVYEYREGNPVLVREPLLVSVDNKEGKPENIHLSIGKRPVAAFGNSDGDREMLEWAFSGKGARLALLVHHDDAVREYAYGEGSLTGALSNALIEEALQKGWTVVSMLKDWNRIFP